MSDVYDYCKRTANKTRSVGCEEADAYWKRDDLDLSRDTTSRSRSNSEEPKWNLVLKSNKKTKLLDMHMNSAFV